MKWESREKKGTNNTESGINSRRKSGMVFAEVLMDLFVSLKEISENHFQKSLTVKKNLLQFLLSIFFLATPEKGTVFFYSIKPVFRKLGVATL